jgi:hypothetical protein
MKFEERVMGGLANFVIRYHKVIPAVALVLLVLSMVAAGTIEVRTQVKDLLPEDNPQVQAFDEVNDLFHGGTVVMVTIEGSDRREMIACAESYAEEVRANPRLMISSWIGSSFRPGDCCSRRRRIWSRHGIPSRR